MLRTLGTLAVTGATATNAPWHNALFTAGDPVAPGGIVEIVGEQFTIGPVAQAATLPLETSLGGATVFVNDKPAPIYYVAATHVIFDAGLLFQPYQGSLSGYAIAVINDGSGNTVFPIPATPGLFSRPAKTGDVLTFYGLGFGQTNPPSAAGNAAPGIEPLARVATPKVVFGQSIFAGTGVAVDPDYAGLTPFSIGLYQINVTIPDAAPRGNAIPIYADMGNGVLSNRVNIAIQ